MIILILNLFFDLFAA